MFILSQETHPIFYKDKDNRNQNQIIAHHYFSTRHRWSHCRFQQNDKQNYETASS